MVRSKAPVTLMLAVVMVAASAVLIGTTGTRPADQAPSLTVVATLSAFVIALCFQQLGTSRTPGERRLLIAALVLAAATLLADARIVMGYRASPLHPADRLLQRWFHN